LNLVALAPAWLVAVLVVALCAGAIEDVARLRISNMTSIVVAVAAVAAAVSSGFEIALWQNFAVFVVVLAVGTAAFGAWLLGGGDVKLFAAAALWFDLRSAVWLVALVFVAGGLVGIACLVGRIARGEGVSRNRSAQVPYGLAIALGTISMIAISRFGIGHAAQPLPPIAMPHVRR
jgi:prepilin peptidase CpaA